LERRSGASEFSFSRGEYPTPAATPYGSSQNGVDHERPSNGTPSLETRAQDWATPLARAAKGRSAKRQGSLALPNQAQTWPTPTVGDSKASGSRNTPTSSAHAGVSLTDAVTTGSSAGRRDRETPTDGGDGSPPVVLSPLFVEALMGFPIGWTGFDALETRSYHSRRKTPSRDLQLALSLDAERRHA